MRNTQASTSTVLSLLTLLLTLLLNAIGCSSPSDVSTPENKAPTTSYMRVMADQSFLYSDSLGSHYGPKEFIASQVTGAPCSIGLFREPGYRIDGYIDELSATITVAVNTDGSVVSVQEGDNQNATWYSNKQTGTTQYFDTKEKKIEGTATASGFSAYAPIDQGMTVHYAVVGW